MPKPFKHSCGKYAVQYGAKLSGTGKPKMVYYDTLDAANSDVRRRQQERKEHGVALVTSEDRTWLAFLKQQIPDLALLPEVVAHWKATGSGSVVPTTVEDAILKFQEHQLPQVALRTRSDIKSRLKQFATAFSDRHMHSLHTGEIEKWLHSYKKPWTRRSYWKRIAPFFDYGFRHRWLAENPLLLLEAPKTKKISNKVYTPGQFVAMLEWSQQNSFHAMLPFLALSGLCFLRTSELVRLYRDEHVLCWEDILWDRRQVHVRGEVAKETRRENDERFPPFGEPFERIMASHINSKNTGMVIPLLHGEFSKLWKRMHSELGFSPIKNGMRRSAISYTLAARPDLGIVQCAKWCGNSESTIKKHYMERLSQEDGERWFNLPVLF
jgi:integrase